MPGSPARQEKIVSADAPVGPDAFESLSVELTAAIDSGAELITVDLSQAQTIDAACLSLIVAATRGLTGERLLIVKTSPSLGHAFADWRLDTVLGLADEETRA